MGGESGGGVGVEGGHLVALGVGGGVGGAEGHLGAGFGPFVECTDLSAAGEDGGFGFVHPVEDPPRCEDGDEEGDGEDCSGNDALL